jgi:UDP-N-acetylglucosamine:LPS N-acetylglucosamine transferase
MKVLAIASKGGHWVEMLRLTKAFNKIEIVYVSTNRDLANTVSDNKFYVMPDSSRWNKLMVLKSFMTIFKIIIAEKPDFIISTGAAPGLMGLLAGKVLGAKTIWIDSIANVEKLSLSGRLAIPLADKIYTQWPSLVDSKVEYAGNVLL